MMFAFSVVCFAAPPPDLTFDRVTNNVEFVTQCNVNQPVYAFKVQEVAFVDIGNFELRPCQAYIFEPFARLEFPAMVMDDNYFASGDQLKKPPSNLNFLAAVNKQHSNYGYPFSANTVFFS
jgi:hypothetical protein